MERISRTGHLSMREAAEWLGMGSGRNAAETLRRRLLEKERQTGSRLIRRGNQGHFEITKAQLRALFPEHFDRREPLITGLAERLVALTRLIMKTRKEKNVLAQQIRELAKRIDRIEQRTATHSNDSPHDLSRREDR